MEWTDFHFLRPYWFLALIPLLFLIWRLTKKTLSQAGWMGVIDEALLPHVLTDAAGENTPVVRKSSLKILLALSGIIAIIALAGPVFERLPQPVYRNDTALVIGLDLSLSMDAEDLKPSRLARARYKIEDLLKQRKGGQTALLVYAGEAFVVTPLTDDTATIRAQLKALSTDLMPVQAGQDSRADKALYKASELLQQAGAKQGDVLLITDGVSDGTDLQRAKKAAQALKNRQYQLLVLGVGTAQGAPIILPGGGYLTDSAGNIVIPTLQEDELKQLTQSVDGVYQSYTRNDDDVNHLSLLLDVNPADGAGQATDLTVERWREEGPWLLLLLIPLAALAFRKGILLVLSLSLSSLMYLPRVEAGDLWHRSDQLGADLLEQGEAAQAATEFEDPRWKASAHYKAGDYQAALKTWGELEHDSGKPAEVASDLYNLGNAQVKVGDYPAALESYKQALQKAPDFADAQYNYDLVKEALEKQQQESETQGGDQDGDQKSDQQGEQSDKGESQSDKDNQQNSNQDQGKDQQGDQSGAEGSDSDSQEQESQAADNESNEAGESSAKEQQQKSETGKNNSESKQQQDKQQQAQQSDLTSEESQQALEQWLRRIPDDPGGLLRRKFIYQYKRQQQAAQDQSKQSGEQAW